MNVVDLMTLQPPSEHPHGLSDRDFDALFTADKPIIFAFHGYPWLIHRLTYRRTDHDNIHVRGYKEEGTTTTPFDMCVMNDLDRFHLVGDVIDRVPKLGERAAYAKQGIRDRLIDHREYIRRYGDDMPEIKNWTWSGREPGGRDLDRGRQRVKRRRRSGVRSPVVDRVVRGDQVLGGGAWRIVRMCSAPARALSLWCLARGAYACCATRPRRHGQSSPRARPARLETTRRTAPSRPAGESAMRPPRPIAAYLFSIWVPGCLSISCFRSPAILRQRRPPVHKRARASRTLLAGGRRPRSG